MDHAAEGTAEHPLAIGAAPRPLRAPGVPSPRSLARRELARALGGALIAPFRFVAWLPRRGNDRAAVRGDVAAEAPALASAPTDAELGRLLAATAATRGGRPLRLFLSAAEASGEIHAASFVRTLQAAAAAANLEPPVCTAFGGERLRALGVTLLGDPVAHARTNFEGVVGALPYYIGLLEDAAREAQVHAPDVFLPVDSPALHVPMARCVRAAGVPVVHLVAPQYWGWAPWRVGAYRRAVDLALTILPHEPRWFTRKGVTTAHIGHPLLDALTEVPRGGDASGSTSSAQASSRTLVVLPGSRAGVIRRNLPWMLESLGLLRAAHPDLEVLVLQATPEHADLVNQLVAESAAVTPSARIGAKGRTASRPVRVVTGDLHGTLARARLAFAVSGTILTDLLHQRLPAVVVYRVGGRVEAFLQKQLLTVPFFASTNLLAGRQVIPEYGFAGDGPRADVERDLVALFGDGLRREACLAGLDLAKERLGTEGALRRAAKLVLEMTAAAR